MCVMYFHLEQGFFVPSLLVVCRWQGKRFTDLPRDRQRKLMRYSLLCIIVSKQTDRDVVFSIYQVGRRHMQGQQTATRHS